MFKRISVFLYGVVSYAVFFGTFLYAIGFIGNFAVPTTLDGAPALSTGQALIIDLLLLGAFALQHSLMARPVLQALADALHPGVRRAQHLRVDLEPRPDRAVRALAAAGRRGVDVTVPIARGVLWGAFAFGWLLVLARHSSSTTSISSACARCGCSWWASPIPT